MKYYLLKKWIFIKFLKKIEPASLIGWFKFSEL
jgi:hypothetical protein